MENLPKTYDETKKLIETLQAHAEKLRKDESDALLEDMRKNISKYGLTAAQLGFITEESNPAPKAATSKTKAPMKYRDGENEWSGRGRTPKWLKELEVSGKKREDYLVDQDRPAGTPPL